MAKLLSDRHGTAAIEFALVAPVIVLLALGLVDGIRRNLAMIDLDAAAASGAAFARDRGSDAGAITAAMATASHRPHRATVEVFACRDDAGDRRCAALPAGRYARIIAIAAVPSLLEARTSADLRATALVRLP